MGWDNYFLDFLKKYQNSLFGAALAYTVIDDVKQAVVKRGIKKIEMSWILEDNIAMRNIIMNDGGREYKTFRIYSKNLWFIVNIR